MRGKETHGWVRGGQKFSGPAIERTKAIETYIEGTKFTWSELRGGTNFSPDLNWRDKIAWDLNWGGPKFTGSSMFAGTKITGSENEGTKLLTEPSAFRGHHFSVLVPSVRGTWTEVTRNSASQIASPPCSLQLQQSARGRLSLSLSLSLSFLRSACDSMQILSFPDTIWPSVTVFVCAIAVAECASDSAMQETVDQ
jgi:hypothetical protein